MPTANDVISMEKERTPSQANGTIPATAGGVSEETSLTVRRLEGEWIVENGVGEAVASCRDQEEAIERARKVAPAQKATGITVLNDDGSKGQTLKV